MHKLRLLIEQFRQAFWALPAIAITLGVGLGLALPRVDRHLALPEWLSVIGDADTARTVLTVVASVCVSVAGVSFSVIVVALVLASQQLSPRVLRSFQSQSINPGVLAMLLGTSTYALFVLTSVSGAREQPIPETAISFAMLLTAAALFLFVIFLHHAVRSLNASVVIRRIAADGHEAVRRPYPDGAGEEPDDPDAAEAAARRCVQEAACCVDVRAPRAGYLASVDGAAVVRWARRAGAFVEQRAAVGDFVLTGGLLATVHVDAEDDLDIDEVCGAFELDEERVVEGDVAFPVRQLADIALKGLSPSVNDPTTAENAMDSIADTLVRYAQHQQPHVLRLDADGRPRLRAIVPALDDLVRLAFDQVRRDAASRPSFCVRLLELLSDLRTLAPAAAECAEIDRQAQLIAEQAADLAELEADQRLVGEAYERFVVP